VVAVLDTPFFYLAVRLSPPAGEPEE